MGAISLSPKAADRGFLRTDSIRALRILTDDFETHPILKKGALSGFNDPFNCGKCGEQVRKKKPMR